MSAARSVIDRKRVGPRFGTPKEPPITDEMREIHRCYCDGEGARQIAARLGRPQWQVWSDITRVHHANRAARIARVDRRELP